MPVLNSISPLLEELIAWRKDLHQNPELGFHVERTAGLVAQRLRAFGCDEVVTGIGTTGVVGVIRGRKHGKVIGLRADMDALPIQEANHFPHRSKVENTMHACGHDGHTTMLLGAARLLAEQRNFDGTAVVIFQPAEEGEGGGRAMVEDGLMERFGIEEVYGMHNMPHQEAGSFAICEGTIMASADRFSIEIQGLGGHAAKPHFTIDPILIGCHIVTALQTLVSRTINPTEGLVISITHFQAGTEQAHNIIPEKAILRGTIRALSSEIRYMIPQRLQKMAADIASAFGGSAHVDVSFGYPITHNHPHQTKLALRVAREVVGPHAVNPALTPSMGAEDFSYMLEKCPGAMIFIGQGETASLHHPAYDFNDAIMPEGISFWVRLVEEATK